MPCYGHSHCALCNIPVCPDCIGNRNKMHPEIFTPDINIENVPYKWLNNGIAIYENNEVYEVSINKQGNMGILCDKHEKGKFHIGYGDRKNALFLHLQCYNYVLKHEDIIPAKNIWWFLRVYIVGINEYNIKDESNYFDGQRSLHQYYHKGDFDNNIYEKDYDISFIWLLENPAKNEQNKKRICNKFNKMLITHDWTDPYNMHSHK